MRISTALTATMPRSNGALHWPIDCDVFSTLTITGTEVATFPAASRAIAVSVCEPSATDVVAHAIEYGAARISAPTLPPSI